MSFQAVVITTSNVSKTLIDVARQKKTAPENLNFDILAVASYYRKSPSPKWITIDEKRKTQLSQIQHLSHPDIYFKEQYKIKIYQRTKPSQSCNPIISLSTNSSKSKVQLIIKKESEFTLTKKSLQEYIHEVKRKLVLSSYLLGIFKLPIEDTLRPMISHFKKEKRFVTDIKIIISNALEPQTSKEGQKVLYYLQKHADQRSAYEQGIDADELVLEYTFPFIARGGRNCQGTYLKPFGPTIETNEVLYFDDTIQKEVEANSIKYFALKTGYVELEEQKLSISNTLNLEGAAFNTTGSITVGGHRDIALKIKAKKNSFDDAVDKGVDIDVSNIDIQGSVGGNTTLKAETVKIDAQTHKTTKIIAQEDASVYLHRGDLTAKNVDVVKLEHGFIQAETAKIGEILGGEVRARQVQLELVHSKAKIYASHSIDITRISGNNNKFFIAPDKVENRAEVIVKLEKALDKKRQGLTQSQSDHEMRSVQYENNYERIDEYRIQVARAVKAGNPPPKSAAIRVRQYMLDTKSLIELEKLLESTQKEIEDDLLYLDRYRNILLFASICFKGSWDGQQEIYYEHPGSDNIEKYMPVGHIDKIVYTEIPSNDLISISGSSET